MSTNTENIREEHQRLKALIHIYEIAQLRRRTPEQAASWLLGQIKSSADLPRVCALLDSMDEPAKTSIYLHIIEFAVEHQNNRCAMLMAGYINRLQKFGVEIRSLEFTSGKA